MGHIGVWRAAGAAVAAVVLAGWVLVPGGGPGASAATMHDTARTAAALSPPCGASAAPGKPTCEVLSSAPAARPAPGPAQPGTGAGGAPGTGAGPPGEARCPGR